MSSISQSKRMKKEMTSTSTSKNPNLTKRQLPYLNQHLPVNCFLVIGYYSYRHYIHKSIWTHLQMSRFVADNVYKIEHIGMQSPQTNIGSRMALLKSAVTFNVAQDATFPISQFFKFLPWSAVCAVIVKWKHLGATTAQPRSGRPYQLTGVLKRVVHKNHMSFVATLISVPNCPWKQLQHNNCLLGSS